MRCPDCNKFVGNEEQDPEVNSTDVDCDGNVSAEVRIANACTECGTELTEFTFNTDADAPEEVTRHIEKCHDDENPANLEIEEGTCERTTRTEGKGRGARTFYGYTLSYTITCSCGKVADADGNVVDGEFSAEGEISEDVQASGMDSCC
jgi:hypothetical protein